MWEGARGGWKKNRNVTINNIDGGWERKGESFGVEKSIRWETTREEAIYQKYDFIICE